MKIEPIRSSHNPGFREALRLHSSRGRLAQNRILVIGQRELARAVAAGVEFEILMAAEDEGELDPVLVAAMRDAKSKSTRCLSLSQPLFDKLAYGDRDAKLIGIAQRPPTRLERLSPILRDQKNALILVLESLEKPGNLGAIARSADAGGVSAILVADTRTDIYHPNAIRASVATVFSVPIACGTTQETQAWLRQHQFRIGYATPDADATLFEADLAGRIAVVVGNEAKGISPTWRTADALGIRVPMMGIGDSLNASVTASLLIYEAYRQRLLQGR